MNARIGMIVLVLAALVAAPAAAQRRSRAGLWVDVGPGFGRIRVVCAQCSSTRSANGATFTLSVGGSVSRYVLVGVEGQYWTGLDTGVHERLASLNLVAHWYPWGVRNGLYLRGGTGLVAGTVIAFDSTAQVVHVNGSGLGISLSIGYDILLNRRLALTFQAGDQIAALGDLTATGTKSDDTIAYLAHLSVSLTFR